MATPGEPRDGPHRVVILGAGFGGLACAQHLDEKIRETGRTDIKVTLIDRGGPKILAPINQLVLTGRWTVEESMRHVTGPGSLNLEHVDIKLGEILALDVPCRLVRIRSSAEPGGGQPNGCGGEGGGDGQIEEVPYDEVVVSLGAEANPGHVPGLAGAAYNMCSYESCLKLKEALEGFEGGDILVMVCKLPHKCPPAPHEFSFIIHDMLTKKGVRSKSRIIYTTPMSGAVPMSDPNKTMQSMSDASAIETHYSMVPVAVDASDQMVTYTDGKALKFDLLVAMYPQRATSVLREIDGLCNKDGWIPVNGRHHRVEGFKGLYVIGDNSTPLFDFTGRPDKVAHPKAGGFAEQQGNYVASVIWAEHTEGRGDWGEPPFLMTTPDRCLIEGSKGTGFWVAVDYFSLVNEPMIICSKPDPKLYDMKQNWVRERLERWYR